MFRPMTKEDAVKLVRILTGDPKEEMGYMEQVRLVKTEDTGVSQKR